VVAAADGRPGGRGGVKGCVKLQVTGRRCSGSTSQAIVSYEMAMQRPFSQLAPVLGWVEEYACVRDLGMNGVVCGNLGYSLPEEDARRTWFVSKCLFAELDEVDA